MKFTIDIEDFYLDEGDELESSLKKHIINEVCSQIQKSIKDRVEIQISMEVKDTIEKQMYSTISKEIKNVIDGGLIKNPDSYSDKKQITISDYIKKKFENDSGWGSPREHIEKLAKSHAEELKKRYDLMFASQIVSKLHQNGMLKEDIAKLLLDGVKS